MRNAVMNLFREKKQNLGEPPLYGEMANVPTAGSVLPG